MLGLKITSIRLARGYTQDYVAKKIGMDQRSYSKIEKGEKVKMDDMLLSQIADALGVSVEDIKCPTPIIMSFQNAESFNKQSSLNPALIDALKQQLTEKDSQLLKKDEQIAQLLSILAGK